MHDNVGKMLKTFSECVAAVGIILCVIGGILVMYTVHSGFAIGLTILVGGSSAFYIGFRIIYAFGDLVENVQIIADKLTVPADPESPSSSTESIPISASISTKADTISDSPNPNHFWICPKCNAHTSMDSYVCSACGYSLIK